ncbi:ABC transporter ATP-binding protein [Candidatus Arthromitus sp. SFB-rat-Yit]|uniref:ABC transporter ATP-binding protein n=1 Tax=Candidatus Arthromitus sp. SFB-rat-Yit TaxID=1041504 RepID=UPI000227A48D|nr:ABC transporter ATP-binding protein [Candidatus Arthromitus sp. SFB-rat-Yit]BAK81553.1 ferrichrome transport ATP-binding protein FhuC [Candidatus Arthromitus sp. SFB-rat-Yit]
MGIKTQNLQINYDEKIIIPSLNLEIPENKVTILIGPNGCGKSTLLKSIMRIIPIKNGKIFLNDKDMKSLSQKEIANKISILPQTPIVPDGIDVKNLISYGRFPHKKSLSGLNKEDYEIINWAMEKTNILNIKDSIVSELSGGQRQRVWISLALAQKTDMIILDEPTTYLDMSHQLEVLELLQDLNRKDKTTIIMVIHELNHATKFADNIIGMKNGNAIFQGNPSDVITRENLRLLYEIDATLIKNEEKGYPICVDYSIIDEK